MTNIHFEALTKAHLVLMHDWFNKPHVQAFYSLRNWTADQVAVKLLPYIEQEKPVHGYVVYSHLIPIAYVQYVSIVDYPWSNQELDDSIVHSAAGLDFFIGVEHLLGTGISYLIIEQFLHDVIWSHYTYCIVDPDTRNERSIKFFEKSQFKKHKIIAVQDALGMDVHLQLMIKINDQL